nr:MAG TPA: hypothetical protein [Caudoviricetes sp.]DAY27190.1 MAG TPA: hypothetical protein [Caudoviricetes sp.]DAZ68345.1 MAG TPA: hypothetical protein [Caudoviricetes sp.]
MISKFYISFIHKNNHLISELSIDFSSEIRYNIFTRYIDK